MHHDTIKQSFFQKAKRFLEPIAGNEGVTVKLTLYFFLEFSIGIVIIFFMRDIVSLLENNQIDAFYATLWRYIFVFLGILILITIFRDWWAYSYYRYREYIESHYMPRYITLDQNTVEGVGTGKIIAIISKGIRTWATLLVNMNINFTQMPLSLCVTVYFLIEINSWLGVLFLILLILGLALGIFLNTLVIETRKNRIELDNIWSRRLVKIIMAKMEILQSHRIKGEIAVLHELQEGQIYWNLNMAKFLFLFFSIGNIIILILLFTIFFYFGDRYFSGTISLANLTALTGAILLMQKDFIKLLDFLKEFGGEFAEVQMMWNFFDSTPQISGYHEGNTFTYKKGDISLHDITYSYTGEKNIFEDFSLTLSGGKITALVGPSGGGKSTLVKLIAGYIRPDTGEVFVDDQKLSETALKSYYEDIGYLTQEPSVFDGTIRENLLYALADEIPSDGKIDEVIRLANCEFIYDFPLGIETEIGERGVRLSGGQKQRLAIAKIFLKDPEIIVLDEPTSALDSLSEKKISEALYRLFEHRTVLVIAHRLQTVKHADDILVIEHGKVIERGTHTALVQEEGFYKQMLDLQSGF